MAAAHSVLCASPRAGVLASLALASVPTDWTRQRETADHDMWDRSRGDLGCFIEANAQEELRRAEAKGGGGGHH